jgi:hypothetical protein
LRTELSLHEADDRLGEVQQRRAGHRLVGDRVDQVLGRQALQHQVQRQVAHHLGGGGDLHDVAEQQVHVPVRVQHGVPLLALQAHARALDEQVGVLAAGDLVVEHARRAGLHAALEGLILVTDLAPVCVVRLHIDTAMHVAMRKRVTNQS